MKLILYLIPKCSDYYPQVYDVFSVKCRNHKKVNPIIMNILNMWESSRKNEYVGWVSSFHEYKIVVLNDVIVLYLGSSDWDHDDFSNNCIYLNCVIVQKMF